MNGGTMGNACEVTEYCEVTIVYLHNYGLIYEYAVTLPQGWCRYTSLYSCLSTVRYG